MRLARPWLLLGCLTVAFTSCAQEGRRAAQSKANASQSTPNQANMEIATFGNGCFWCTEAIFQDLIGVSKVVSGYTGGHVANPTYKEVCTGNTGHAEVLQVTYDPAKISYEELLEVFWQTHDPTTLNQQGNDVGTQYRSVVYYHNDQQKSLAEAYKNQLTAAHTWKTPIVTTIEPAVKFYSAEEYHQNYFKNTGDGNSYCTYVIRPKVEKFRKSHADKLVKQ